MLYGAGAYYGDGDYYGDDLAMRGLTPPLTSEGYEPMDANVIERKEGSTRPSIHEVLRDANGAAINLSDATEVLIIVGPPVGGIKFQQPCDILDRLGGEVEYLPVAGDFTHGVFRVEFKITREDGTVLMVPSGDSANPTRTYRKLKVFRRIE